MNEPETPILDTYIHKAASITGVEVVDGGNTLKVHHMIQVGSGMKSSDYEFPTPALIGRPDDVETAWNLIREVSDRMC